MAFLDEEFRFAFGKYKGEPIQSVIDRDIHYCIWLRNQEFAKTDSALYEVLEKLEEPPLTMPWGKYKGRSLSASLKPFKCLIS